jgi:hypothetical protein
VSLLPLLVLLRCHPVDPQIQVQIREVL